MNWKKMIMPGSLSAAVALAAVTGGCTGAGTKSNDETTRLATDSVTYINTVPMGDSPIYCQIAIAYPVADGTQCVDSIKRWIGKQFSVSPLAGPDTAPFPYDTITDGNRLAQAVGSRLTADSETEILDLLKEGIDSPGYEFYYNIYDLYQTDRFVTYMSSDYIYLGGAHGSASETGTVFAKADGRQYGWDMFKPGSKAELTGIIKESLMKDYFQVSTADEFKDRLLVDADTLPLPVTAPYFTANGVAFVYQQYEIAPYSEGMPSVTVPYATARPLMTADAAALLK